MAVTAPNPLQAAIEALAQCRVLIEDEREVRFNSYTIGGDPTTMDADTAAKVADCDNCLIAIDEAIPTLRAALADAGWRGIESAPMDRRILAWTGRNQYVAIWTPTCDDDDNRALVKATHWMPLPSPPTEGTEP